MRIPIEGGDRSRQEPAEEEDGELTSLEPPAGLKDEKTEQEPAEATQDELAAKEAEIKELKDRWLRVQAEFQNFKKRVERDKLQFREQATAELIQQLLPVLDNLEKALGHSANRPEETSLRQGMELILSQLKEALEKEGLAQISAAGELFDPAVHEAVMTVEVDDSAAERVVEEFQKGYLLRGKLLRPAKISVGKAKEPTE